MKALISGLFLLVIFFVGCDSDTTVKAKIFERKEIGDKKIMIRFNYIVGDKSYTDSTEMNNQVINTDSIKVKYDPANPAKAIILFD